MLTGGAATPEQKLLRSIKESLNALESLLEDSRSHWWYEDPVYRFYHHSFKVYAVQRSTESIVGALQALRPEEPLPRSPAVSSSMRDPRAHRARKRSEPARDA